MNNQFNEEAQVNNDSPESENKYAYKTVIKNKENRRTWSVASLALAVLSVLLLWVQWLSLVLGVVSIGTGVISRKNLGYFDKFSIAGIIVGIFGCVFAIGLLIFDEVISSFLF